MDHASDLDFLSGGGTMGEVIRRFDWSSSPLGPPAGWPAALRMSLRILLTTNHPVFIFWGPDARCFYNDAYSRSLGPERHPSILGLTAEEAWPEIWHIIAPQIDHVMAGRGATWHENQLVPTVRHGAKHEVYWTYSYSPIDSPDAPSGVGGVLVLCTETTEQVHTTARLAQADARWRQLFDQTPGFMAMLGGPEHIFEFANPAFFRLIEHADVIGRPVGDALPWTIGQGFVALLDEVWRSGEAYIARSAHVKIPVPGSREQVDRYIDFVYQPIRDERSQITGIFVLGNDVTDHRLAEEALRESEGRLRIACDAAEIGIYDYDISTDVARWDSRVRQLFGVGDDEAVDYARYLDCIDPADHAAVKAAFVRASNPAGTGHYFTEYRTLDPSDGTRRWIETTGQVSFVDGRPVRLVGAVQDITERKEADRRRAEFLATLGHELRNPLATITNAIQLMRREGRDASLGPTADLLDRQLSHLVRLIDDLLDVVRVTRGRIDLRMREIDLADVIALARETAAPYIERGGHHVRYELPTAPVHVMGDVDRLAQLVSNLLINACKYSDPGGRIDVSVVRDGDGEVVTRVVDAGIGIAAENLPRMFEMFSQADLALDRAEGGLGVGLALAKAITELHGGRISAHSEGLGRGSEFRVRLPAIETGAESTPEAPVGGSETAIAAMTILIVDDNQDAAVSMAELLRLCGADVRTAFDGRQGLDAHRRHAPQLVLLDLGMPGMNGYDVARAIRAEPGGDTPWLVALTGFGQPDDLEESKRAGFDGHLIKPVRLPDLLAYIERLPPR